MNKLQNLTLLLLSMSLNPMYPQAAELPETFSRMELRHFGTMEDGSQIQQITLRNRHGMEARVITYGATLTAIELPTKGGGRINVIEGEETLQPYLKGFPAASVIGRVANRIAGASFELDGVSYEVTRNAGRNHIHGGRKGFASVPWKASPMPLETSAAAVQLIYEARDGEEGFPGNLKTSVTYRLDDENALSIAYAATTDKATPINLTNHAYFNLAESGGFEDHVLTLHADTYTVAGADLIPTGEIGHVEGTALDFRTPHPIGERADATQPRPHLYDHNYIIRHGGDQMVPTAKVVEPLSGRVMHVLTDQPGVQLYTGNPRGFCLETQHYPDSVHQPSFPSTILRPGERFASTTVYAFEF